LEETFSILRLKVQEIPNKRSGDHGNTHFFQLLLEDYIGTFWGAKGMTNKVIKDKQVSQGSHKKLGDEFPKGSHGCNKHKERKVDKDKGQVGRTGKDITKECLLFLVRAERLASH
jgi:hypothetical protein